ncbi:MAG: 6-carboxytetrahydropterin synthase [Armatimonadetes bacterium]|nr:6-carboxytetrahydropterin synthase [Armatimonadota bacterium]
MPRYRVCRTFVVESGHMLSKHPESCRYPHGHTRHIEVVVSADELDSNQMVVDFKALKLAVTDIVEKFDHRMAINSADPLLDSIRAIHPDSLIVLENEDPTTEVIARHLYVEISQILQNGFVRKSPQGFTYQISPRRVHLDRVRVGETPTSWAEYGD